MELGAKQEEQHQMTAITRDLTLDVVSELGEEVCHVFHVHVPADSINQPFQCRFPLILTTRTRIILIDIETSQILFTYDVQALRDSAIIDCLYLADIKSLLVLLADSSLVRITLPNLQSKEETNVEHMELPFSPYKLLDLGSKGVAIVFTNGIIYYFSALKPGAGLPEKPVDTNKVKAPGNIGKIYCCSNQYHLTIIRENTKTGEHVVTTWNSKQLSQIGNKYQMLDDKLGFSHSTKNKLSIASLTTNHTASYSIFYSPSNTVASKKVDRNKNAKNSQDSANDSAANAENLWVKYELTGEVLFERVLPSAPVSANNILDKVFTLHEGNKLCLWDSKYGVQLCQFNITETAPLNTCIYKIIRNIDSVGSANDSYHFVCCKPVQLKPHKSTDMSYTICSQLLDVPSQVNKGSLFSVMGSLRDCVDTTVAASSSSTETTVFASLSRVHRRQLQDAQYKLTKHETDNVDITLQKKRKLYLDVPLDASTAFLTRLNEVGINGVFQVSDWDVIKLLLRSHTISLTSHSMILIIAYKNHRYDVLADIAKYVSDLDENVATKLLQMAISCEEKNIGRMGVRNGLLVLRKDKVAAKPAKKNAKSASDANDTDLVVEEENQDTQVTTPATPLLIVHMIAKALVQRNSAFSSVLLTEALRNAISSQGAVLLIRLYLKFLDGLKHVAGDSNEVERVEVKYDELTVVGELNDMEMKRAILWIQCLVDAHFTSLALNVETNSSVRRALVAAMNIVKDCDKSLETLELLAGTLEHLCRQNRIRKNEGIVNKSSVYAIETLSF